MKDTGIKFAIGLSLIISIQGCSSTGSSSASTEINSNKAQVSQCLDVTSEKVSEIVSGQQEAVGMIPLMASAIKSLDFNNVYFIAIKFSATGIDDSVGVWATNNLETGGTNLAIDYVAQEFSIWPWGSASEAKISANDPAVQVVTNCLK